MIRVFSKRHARAIRDQQLKVSVPIRVRTRIWGLLNQHDASYYYRPDSTDNWTDKTTYLQDLDRQLRRAYGEDLRAYGSADKLVSVDLEGFVRGAYPPKVFDAVELFYDALPTDDKARFAHDLNGVLLDEESPWRLVDGQFFQVDSKFLELEVLARSYELMVAEGCDGAADEFREARNDLTAGDTKGAIHNACKSFESVLKAVLKVDSGNASALIRSLTSAGFYSGLPEPVSRSFGEQVLMSLASLRNTLGGHGQGQAQIEVPRSYAELAVHLAASFNFFILRRSIELANQPEPSPVEATDEDELPF